jgi:hypothetical protein
MSREFEENNSTWEYDFLDFAIGEIQEELDVAMTGVGLREDIREAIMDPVFEHIRTTESITYWVKDALEIKYLSLEGLQKESKRRREGRLAAPMTEVKKVETNFPGRINLYKAITKERLKYDKTGKIIFWKLKSSTPSDFCGDNGLYFYFIPTIGVANWYLKYIRRRDGPDAGVVISVTTPNEYIEHIPPYVLPFGDLWKEIIWISRRGDLLEVR